MKENNPILSPVDVKELGKEFEILRFQTDFDLIYENQIPTAGFVVVSGSIELMKNSKVRSVIPPRNVIGLSHLLEGTPSKLGLRVKANSEIIVIGKSILLISLKKKQSPLLKLLKNSI